MINVSELGADQGNYEINRNLLGLIINKMSKLR